MGERRTKPPPPYDGTPPTRGRPARLSREQVVAAAVQIVRESGFENLTMRALAREVEATPMAVYRHVAHRDDLVKMVLERIFAAMPLPDMALDAMPWMRELAHAVRSIGREHPGAMDVLLEEGPIVRSTLLILDRTVCKLHSAGIPWKEATSLHNAFFSWLAGTVRLEERWLRMDARTPPFATFVAEARTLAATGDYPGLAHALPHMPGSNLDAAFEASLRCMLDVVAFRIARRPAKLRKPTPDSSLR